MDLYKETFYEFTRRIERVWNYGHPSGYAGRVTEVFSEEEFLLARYYEVGKQFSYHRDFLDGPAVELYYSNGKPFSIEFYKNGKRHCPVEHGYAKVLYSENGRIISAEYWVEGVKQNTSFIRAFLKKFVPNQ